MQAVAVRPAIAVRQSLSDRLSKLGITATPRGLTYTLSCGNIVLFRGTAFQVAAWMVATRQVTFEELG